MYHIKITSKNRLAGSKESEFRTSDFDQALEHYQRKCSWLGAEPMEIINDVESFQFTTWSDDYRIEFFKTIVIDDSLSIMVSIPPSTPAPETIYICGPITGIPDGNRHLFKHVQLFYEKEGFRVINPHELCADIQGSDEDVWSKCMARCMNALCQDQVKLMVVLPGSENSRGASLEIQIAAALKIRCVEWATEKETII
jgi:hypothetical protein